MADNEWHTVSNHKPISHSHQNKHYRRRQSNQISSSIGGKSLPKSLSKSLSKSFQGLHINNNSKIGSVDESILSVEQYNPYHLPEEDDSDIEEEEEDDDQIDPIDIPLPPYHITLVINCPFDNCSAMEPFVDTTALVQHFKSDHQLVFRNLHHMYMALEAYLNRWAKIFQKESIKEHGVLEDEGNK